MSNRNLGALFLLFVFFVLGSGLVSGAAISGEVKNSCSDYCISNGFSSGSSVEEGASCGESDYRRTYTDVFGGKDRKMQDLTCCCVGTGKGLDEKEGQELFDTGSSGLFGSSSNNVLRWFSGWEQGVGVDTVFIKYLFLTLIFILVYSSFGILKFPDEAYLRVILSVVIGILFTVVINPQDIIAMMINYKAVGVTLLLFFPIMVLGFFSFVVASTVNAMGIVLQRVIWGMYSVFLFINSGTSLLAGMGTVAPDSFLVSVFNIFEKIGGSYFIGADQTILMTLFVASIIIFFTMVLNNKYFIEKLIEEVREAKVQRYEEIGKTSQGMKKADAALVDKA